jgi:hypothetical protein
MIYLGVEAFEKWTARVQKRIDALLIDQANGKNVTRELAEYRKLISQAVRVAESNLKERVT